MSETLDHLAAVYRDQTGYVFIGAGSDHRVTKSGKVVHDKFAQEPFSWPRQADELDAYVTAAVRAGCDTYFTPALSENPIRKAPRRKCLPVATLWADLDGGEDNGRLAQIMLSGDCWTVASGRSGHRHLYVPLVEEVDADTAEDLLRRLAAWLGADPAPTRHGSYLRPAGTLNFKPRVLGVGEAGEVSFHVERHRT